MIAAARLLNRTVVLPPLVEGRWMANHNFDRPQESVGNFYDTEALSQYVDVMEESSFVQEYALLVPELSTELHVRDFAYTGQLNHLGLGWGKISLVEPHKVQKVRSPSEILNNFKDSRAHVLAIDFSYRFIDFGVHGEHEYFNGTVEWTPPEVKIKFEPPPLYSEALHALSFSRNIWIAADRVIDDAHANGNRFRSNHSLPSLTSWIVTSSGFLAIHLRRNDMRNWVNRQHAWPSLDQVIAQAQALLVKFGLNKVFLATDADDLERSELTRLLPAVFDQRMADGMSEAQVAVIDQAVCAKASAFLGNFWSTFTWAILEERFKQGYASTTSEFMQAPFVGAKEGDGSFHRPKTSSTSESERQKATRKIKGDGPEHGHLSADVMTGPAHRDQTAGVFIDTGSIAPRTSAAIQKTRSLIALKNVL